VKGHPEHESALSDQDKGTEDRIIAMERHSHSYAHVKRVRTAERSSYESSRNFSSTTMT
jgi:hypothetical protein